MLLRDPVSYRSALKISSSGVLQSRDWPKRIQSLPILNLSIMGSLEPLATSAAHMKDLETAGMRDTTIPNASHFVTFDQPEVVASVLEAIAVALAIGALAFARWNETGSLFFLPLCFRELIAAYLFAVRAPAVSAAGWKGAALAYASAALPLFYLAPNGSVGAGVALVASLLFIAGFLMTTLATIELGTRLGVAPAFRGDVVRTGVYRCLRHPMYLGYVIAEAGMVLLNPLSGLLFSFSVAGYWQRAKFENGIMMRSQLV